MTLSPYPNEKVISWNAYHLKPPPSFDQTHPVFSVTLLRPYNADTITEHVQCHPPPIVCDGIEEYQIEQILDSQVFRGRLEYLVCWKGYGIKEDDWRPAGDVKGSKWLVSEFHCRNPEAPQHISTLYFANLPFHPISNLTDTPDTHWEMGKVEGCPQPNEDITSSPTSSLS